jgi:hypothetical protein
MEPHCQSVDNSEVELGEFDENWSGFYALVYPPIAKRNFNFCAIELLRWSVFICANLKPGCEKKLALQWTKLYFVAARQITSALLSIPFYLVDYLRRNLAMRNSISTLAIVYPHLYSMPYQDIGLPISIVSGRTMFLL